MVVAGEVSTRICDAVLCGRCTVWSRSGVFGRGLVVGSLRGAAVWCSVIQIAFFFFFGREILLLCKLVR